MTAIINQFGVVEDPDNTAGKVLPREIAPGVHWLGDCMLWPGKDKLEHSYTAIFLVSGDDASLLVDTGHPKDWEVEKKQLDELLIGKGLAPLKYVFPTHPEVTHGGNLGRLLERYPDAMAIGDMRDQHLIFPQHEDRFIRKKAGESVDLGNREFVFVEAVFRDLLNTLWGYDRQEQVLFSSDGMGFGHYHGEEHCGKFAEEIPDLPIAELTGIFVEYALYWSRLKSVEPKIARLNQMLDVEYPTKLVCGAHGSSISDPEITLPKVKDGMRELAKQFSLR
ncbi:MBL fold metallo-hydrolase [Mycolicibacterium litorale]|uniref:MBL fold metallo-hydrolase n=1 Tax=Mycolicibacterium litorale TaxID=758802 RepID=UPI003CF6BF92